MKKRVLLIVLAVVLSLPVGLFGLLNTQAGTRWLLRQGFAFLPAEVTADTIEGRLLQRLTLTGFEYKSDSAHIVVDRFVFAWQPTRLFRGALDIDDITVDTVDITLTPSAEPAEKPPFDPNNLPRLPLDIFIDRMQLTDLTFKQGETEQHIDHLKFSALTENDRLKIPDLTLDADSAALNAKAEVTLRGELAFLLDADFEASTEAYGAWKARAQIHGDTQEITLDGRLDSPFGLDIKGTAKDWADKPRLNLNAEWQKLSWPFAVQNPQLVSDKGSLEIIGPLDNYRILLNGELSPQALPKAMLELNGKGSLDALAIDALELKSPDGIFRATGDISWQPEIAFDMALTAKDFNPGILSPELPGKVSMDVRNQGKFLDDKLQLNAGINKLSGNLRGRPLTGGGKLTLADDILKVDSLTLASGTNKIALNGTLGSQRETLDISIDARNLKSLWPTLGGRFEGTGQLRGAWKRPSLTLQGKGKALRFAEHSVEQLDLDIDYKAEAKENSKITISAHAVKSGESQIRSLSLDGSGSERRHDFTVRIDSPRASLSTALGGSLKADRWEGKLTRLDIRRTQDDAHWRLEAPWPMRAQKKPEGIDLTLGSGCLIGLKSSLCAEGHYWPTNDFKVEAHMLNFPTGLFRDYFPEGFDLSGLIDADVSLRRQKDALAGHYTVSLPGRITLQLPTKQKSRPIVLGPGSLSGELKGQEITAVADLRLVDQDYLRGRLRLNTSAPQTLAGRINASVRRLDLVKPFVSELSDIKGHLRVDLDIEGTLPKPGITGTLDLSEGRIEMAGLGFALREINLQAVASGRHENHIQLQGTTQLVVLASQIAAGQKPVQEQVKVEADARLNNQSITATLNLGLGNRNRIDANLRMDTHELKTVDGQVKAALTDWSLLTPLTAAQLSNLKGRLAADIGIKGRLDKPEINGNVNLSDGAVDVLPLGISVHEVRLGAVATGDPDKPIRITGFARSGQGSLNLDGYANPSGNGELQLAGSQFEAARLPEAQVAVTPDLSLRLASDQRKISGTLKIPKARIELKELPENAVKVSKDEVILGEEKKQQDAVPQIPVDANVEVELGQQIHFSGMGLDSDLTGKFRVDKRGQKTTAYGDVEMKKATYQSYGQDLTVRRGKIVFNGPLNNPWLDVEATRLSKDEKVTAIVDVSGPLNAPKTRLSSNPPLPETDVLAYLVTGGPLDQAGQNEGERIASAALAYGSSRVSWIANKLGLSEFEIKEGKTLEDTLVQAGRYLSPGFYVGAKVGLFNNQAALVMKRKLTENLNLETQAGTAQRVKINYEFDTD
ncbi:MAG: translocation/assembly module TamB domain-containing protein [Methylomicrobium sp.]